MTSDDVGGSSEAVAVIRLTATIEQLVKQVEKMEHKLDGFSADDRSKIEKAAILETRLSFVEKVLYGIVFAVLAEGLGMLSAGIVWIIQKAGAK